MIVIKVRRGLILPELRVAPAYTVGGGTSQAITTQVGTLTDDLTLIFAFSTTPSVGDEAVPGALMTTLDTDTGARKGRAAYRIFDGTTNLTTWTNTTAWGIMTFKAGTYNDSSIFSNGGAGYFNVSTPDNNVLYPALTAPPHVKCLKIDVAFSNQTVGFGQISGSTDMWNRSNTTWNSRAQYRNQTTAWSNTNVTHTIGSSTETLQFSAYLRGYGG